MLQNKPIDRCERKKNNIKHRSLKRVFGEEGTVARYLETMTSNLW